MRFRCERDSLAEALGTSERAAGGRTASSPVLSGLLLRVAGNRLTVVGTDLDLTIQSELEVIGHEDGSCVVPSRLATDIVRSLEPGAVSITGEEDKVEISAARSTFGLRAFPVVEFPPTPLPDGPETTLPAAGFLEGLRQVVRAASSDDARPLLTGVLLTAEEDGLRLVATDSYRLALRDLDVRAELGERGDILVPAHALAELQRLQPGTAGSGEDPVIRVATGPHDVSFVLGNVRVSSRLLDGTYPDYRQLIPDGYPNRLHLGKETLLSALRRVRLLVRDNTTPVRLSMRPGGVDLTVTSQGDGDAHEAVDGDFAGEDLVIAFNPAYLIDGVEAVRSDEVVIETAEPARPATVRAADDHRYRYLLMPVRVQ